MSTSEFLSDALSQLKRWVPMMLVAGVAGRVFWGSWDVAFVVTFFTVFLWPVSYIRWNYVGTHRPPLWALVGAFAWGAVGILGTAVAASLG